MVCGVIQKTKVARFFIETRCSVKLAYSCTEWRRRQPDGQLSCQLDTEHRNLDQPDVDKYHEDSPRIDRALGQSTGLPCTFLYRQQDNNDQRNLTKGGITLASPPNFCFVAYLSGCKVLILIFVTHIQINVQNISLYTC